MTYTPRCRELQHGPLKECVKPAGHPPPHEFVRIRPWADNAASSETRYHLGERRRARIANV